MSASQPPLEAQIIAVLESRFNAAVDLEIEEAKKRLEDRMRLDAARVAIQLSKFYSIETFKDYVTIRVLTKELNLL